MLDSMIKGSCRIPKEVLLHSFEKKLALITNCQPLTLFVCIELRSIPVFPGCCVLQRIQCHAKFIGLYISSPQKNARNAHSTIISSILHYELPTCSPRILLHSHPPPFAPPWPLSGTAPARILCPASVTQGSLKPNPAIQLRYLSIVVAQSFCGSDELLNSMHSSREAFSSLQTQQGWGLRGSR
jgi:hypothetical protein